MPQPSLAQADAARVVNVPTLSIVADLPAAGIHTPSADLGQLLNLSGQVPDVRTDLLKDVAQRLAAGEYRTPRARDAAIQAILGSQPG